MWWASILIGNSILLSNNKFNMKKTMITIILALLAIPSMASAAVTSVGNSDGSLTISPSTGVVSASVNTAHPNEWIATQLFSGTGNPSSAPLWMHSYWNWTDNDISILSVGNNANSNSLRLNWNKANQAFEFSDSLGALKPIRASSVYGSDYVQSNWVYSTNMSASNQINVLGDIYHYDQAKGAIWKKPKGGCVRQTINTDNSFNFATISCPNNI
jgi:hypothetical protein